MFCSRPLKQINQVLGPILENQRSKNPSFWNSVKFYESKTSQTAIEPNHLQGETLKPQTIKLFRTTMQPQWGPAIPLGCRRGCHCDSDKRLVPQKKTFLLSKQHLQMPSLSSCVWTAAGLGVVSWSLSLARPKFTPLVQRELRG